MSATASSAFKDLVEKRPAVAHLMLKTDHTVRLRWGGGLFGRPAKRRVGRARVWPHQALLLDTAH